MQQLLQSQGSHCQQYETDHKGALKRLQFSVIEREMETRQRKRKGWVKLGEEGKEEMGIK